MALIGPSPRCHSWETAEPRLRTGGEEYLPALHLTASRGVAERPLEDDGVREHALCLDG